MRTLHLIITFALGWALVFTWCAYQNKSRRAQQLYHDVFTLRYICEYHAEQTQWDTDSKRRAFGQAMRALAWDLKIAEFDPPGRPPNYVSACAKWKDGSWRFWDSDKPITRYEYSFPDGSVVVNWQNNETKFEHIEIADAHIGVRHEADYPQTESILQELDN